MQLGKSCNNTVHQVATSPHITRMKSFATEEMHVGKCRVVAWGVEKALSRGRIKVKVGHTR